MHNLSRVITNVELPRQRSKAKAWKFWWLLLIRLLIRKIYEDILQLSSHCIINTDIYLCENHNEVEIGIEIGINCVDLILWVTTFVIGNYWVVVENEAFPTNYKFIIFWDTAHTAHKEGSSLGWDCLDDREGTDVPNSDIAFFVDWYTVGWFVYEFAAYNCVCMSFKSALKRPCNRNFRLPNLNMCLETASQHVSSEFVWISNWSHTSWLFLPRILHNAHQIILLIDLRIPQVNMLVQTAANYQLRVLDIYHLCNFLRVFNHTNRKFENIMFTILFCLPLSKNVICTSSDPDIVKKQIPYSRLENIAFSMIERLRGWIIIKIIRFSAHLLRHAVLIN